MHASSIQKIVSVLLSMILVTSCAAQAPTIAHLDDSQTEQGHDELIYPHATIDIYPNRNTPHRIVMREDNGAFQDLTCMDDQCLNLVGPIRGSQIVQDGIYQVVRTDDPKVAMLRNPDNQAVAGYMVSRTGTDSAFFKTLPEAQAYEHKGDTLKLVGKIVLVTLLVGVVVLGAAAAAQSQANANTVTTRCTTIGITTTWTSR
jgi:hypothetical protein